MDTRDKIIVGYSQHSYAIIEELKSKNHSIKGYLDTDHKLFNPYNLNYLGDENKLENKLAFSNSDFLITIGDIVLRKKIFNLLLGEKLNICGIKCSSSFISDSSEIDKTAFIMNHAIIHPFSKIKQNVLINTNAIIEHGAIVENNCHIGPNAVLLGGVIIGADTLVGANATILPGVRIGKKVIVGAGSVITKDVPSNQVIKGNPGK